MFLQEIMIMGIKFVSEKDIPARMGHGTKKYQDLYDTLQKKPGAWVEITQPMKYTLSHRDSGKKTYPGVKTMKRGERFFASFEKEGAKKTRSIKTKRAALRKGSKKKGKRS
jgi:flavodoxin